MATSLSLRLRAVATRLTWTTFAFRVTRHDGIFITKVAFNSLAAAMSAASTMNMASKSA